MSLSILRSLSRMNSSVHDFLSCTSFVRSMTKRTTSSTLTPAANCAGLSWRACEMGFPTVTLPPPKVRNSLPTKSTIFLISCSVITPPFWKDTQVSCCCLWVTEDSSANQEYSFLVTPQGFNENTIFPDFSENLKLALECSKNNF
jgi:hypothetical protein